MMTDTVFQSCFAAFNGIDDVLYYERYCGSGQRSDVERLLRSEDSFSGRPDDRKALEDVYRFTVFLNEFRNGYRPEHETCLFEYFDRWLLPDVVIVTVPSHDPANTMPPIRKLAMRLTTKNRVDGTGSLVRDRKIEQITMGGPSTYEVHWASIAINPTLVVGQKVFLLDDIAYTYNSLRACRDFLGCDAFL